MTSAKTFTILFTDVVGSTELLQRAGDEQAQRIFKAHHRLLREDEIERPLNVFDRKTTLGSRN